MKSGREKVLESGRDRISRDAYQLGRMRLKWLVYVRNWAVMNTPDNLLESPNSQSLIGRTRLILSATTPRTLRR